MLSAETLQNYLAINLVRGIGPRLQTLLMERFQTPEAILNASLDDLCSVKGISRKIAEEIRSGQSLDMARREWEDCQKFGVSLLAKGEEGYPQLLLEIADPPLVLYQKGELLLRDQLAIAIVGSRHCTAYGKKIAEQLSSGLARAGITIISGLAYGIDAVAHRAALQAGGRTIAVCAPGLAQIYPPEHQDLAEEISRQGAIITESPLLRKPVKGLFPQRNRIVSGMSLGVLVVEASSTSGTLHTARHAMEQGREVFAVPGPINSTESAGCHALIRDGVKLVRGIDDVLEDLGPLMTPVKLDSTPATNRRIHLTPNSVLSDSSASVQTIEIRTPRELNLTEQQQTLLNLLNEAPVEIDQLIERSGLEASRVITTMTTLEMKRLVQRLPGNRFLRHPH